MLCFFFFFFFFFLTLPGLGFKTNFTNNFLFTIRNVFLGTWPYDYDVLVRLKAFFFFLHCRLIRFLKHKHSLLFEITHASQELVCKRNLLVSAGGTSFAPNQGKRKRREGRSKWISSL